MQYFEHNKFVNDIVKALTKRKEVYSQSILYGLKNYEEYKHTCGKYYALDEAIEIVIKSYRDLFDSKLNQEEEKSIYGEETP